MMGLPDELLKKVTEYYEAMVTTQARFDELRRYTYEQLTEFKGALQRAESKLIEQDKGHALDIAKLQQAQTQALAEVDKQHSRELGELRGLITGLEKRLSSERARSASSDSRRSEGGRSREDGERRSADHRPTSGIGRRGVSR
jgi:hypothetical protein